MKVWDRVEFVWDASRQEYVLDEAASSWHEYEGPVALCKKDSKMPSPDPAIGQAGLANIELGKQWLAFAKEQFAESNERQKNVDAVTKQVVDYQLDTQKKTDARADEQWARQIKLFQPLEDRMVSEANNYDSAERQDQQAGIARADAMQGAADAQQIQARRMAAMGVSPTSGRYEGIDRSTTLAAELAGTGAANKARVDTQNMGIMLRKDAANFGRGLTSTAAQSYGIGLQAGNSASGNQLGAEGNFRANQGIMTSGFGGGMQGNSSGAGILNSLYSNQVQAFQAQSQADSALMNAVGQGVGAAAGAY